MSEQEKINFTNLLDKGLRHSYEQMLQTKVKLGESVVVSDGKGNSKEISAEEAWNNYKKTQC